jgi:hypothetical protein
MSVALRANAWNFAGIGDVIVAIGGRVDDGGPKMAQVIAKCRLTGHYLFMRIELDPGDLSNLSDPFARKFCPYCACEHAWYRKDAKLVDARPSVRPGVQQAS